MHNAELGRRRVKRLRLFFFTRVLPPVSDACSLVCSLLVLHRPAHASLWDETTVRLAIDKILLEGGR